MFEILRLINEKNTQIVQVVSLPGMGKSSLLRNITNHIFERNLFSDGVLYFNFHKIDQAKELVE